MMGRKSITHLKAFLKLPGHLLGRVRLIFLLAALVMAALPVPMILSRNAVGGPLQALAIAGLLWLCWLWIRGYKRANFPPLWYIPEGVAVFAAAVAVGNPLYAEGLVYTGLMFRSLYGTRRNVVAMLLIYLGAFCGAVVIAMSFTNVDLPLATVLTQLPGLPLMAALLYVVAASVARYKRATFREAIFRETGFKLVAAPDRESIYQATFDAALKLVEDTPEARVGLATGSEEAMTVVASAGYRAAEIRGHSFNIHSLPPLLCDCLLEKQPIEVERPESSDMREALGLSSRIRPFFMAPLFIGENLRGIIGVTSASTLSEESKEGLVALSSQVSLALESSALAEEAHRRKSEERFRSLIQNASDIIMIMDADGSVSYISPAVERVLGYKPEDIVGTDSFVPVHPDDMIRVQNLFAEVASKPGAASKFELRLQHADGSWRHLEASVTNLLHDPTVGGLVVNSRDVTERRQAEDTLRESEEKFRLLAENAQDVIFRSTLQPTPRVEYISPSVKAMSGYEPEEFYADPHLGHKIVHPEDRQALDESLRSMSGSMIALRWIRKDGSVIWAEQRNNPIYNEAGELVAIEGIARDITESRRAEKKLQESEANLTEAQQIAHLGSWEHESKNNRVYWSDETYRILGFTPQQFVPTFEDFLNAVHPDDRVLIQEDMANLLRGEQLRDGGIEYRIVRANGEVRSVQSQRGAELDETGGLIRMFGAIQDITERKWAEEQVRFQAHLLGQVQAAVIATDLRGTVTHWNEYAERLYGWPPEEALGRNIVEMMYGLAEAGRAEEIMERLRTSGTSEGEYMLRRRDGSTFFAYATSSVIYDAQGQAAGIVGVSTDVTERKHAEEELRRRESELTEAQRIAHVGNWSFDIIRNEGQWSDEMYRTFGFAPQEFPVTYKTFLNLVHPDDKDLVRKAVRAAFYKDVDWHSLDYRLVRPDGTVRFLHSQYKIVRDESKRSIRIVGTSQDVTERKQAEEELSRSEERFRRLVEQAADPLFVHDLRGKFVEVNKQACESLGYTQEELLSMSVSDIEENFDSQGLDELWEQVVSSGPVMIDGVNRRKDGTTFPVEIRLGLFEVGKERLMLAVARDVTERKRAEDAIRESEERYRAVVQQSAEGMFLVDLSTKRILDANSAYQALLGYDAEEMLGLTLYDVVAHDRESIDFHVQRIVDEGNHTVGERQHRRKDGSLVEVEVTASLISYSGRSAMSVVAHDVTERKQAEAELRKSEARNRAILEATPDLMFRVSRDGEYLDFRAKDDSKLFVPREEIVGKTLHETMPPDLTSPMLRQVAKTLDTGEMQTFDYHLPVADGVLDFEARLVVSGPGEVLSIVRDVTERKALERRLEHQAFHDALTGLPNRALFLDRLEHALSRSGRRQESVTVLFIDLDNFKVINDSLGHDAGDELLIAVAVRLQECLRTEDTLARLGGDEFTILIEDLGGITQATNVAQRVAHALQKPFVLRGQEVFVTASVGIALDDLVQNEPGGFLRSADLAMYRAKANGKNRYEVFDLGMNERALQRMRLENELRRALERNELRVYYQPKLQLVERNIGLQRRVESANGRAVDAPVTLPNPRIVGMEALVRWEHPELGLVAPPQFIPIAEETGLIVPMGRWVLREACRQARQWQEFYPSEPPLTMSVNLSAREFQQPDLAEAVVEILDETGLSPSSLDLEITESLLMENTERTVGTLQALKNLEVQLSIDDFGTGYSSLSYLDRFPVDNLKIDKTFVEKLGKSHKDTALVSTTITLSHDFGLKAIAEGLETADQLQRLRELRCDQVQGYYFSKPLPSREMSAMLTAGLESKVGGLPE